MIKMASLFIFLLVQSHIFCSIAMSKDFSSIKLVHRDSPNSLLYRANLSYLDSFKRDIETSKIRASNLVNDHLQIPLFSSAPLFTVDIGIGTPALKNTLIFDTSVPLTWIQCQPCIRCFKQNTPIFDQTKSTSFARIRRSHKLAGWFNCTVLECYYFVENFRDQSSQGLVSTETFSLKNNVQIGKEIVFGCGTHNYGPLGTRTTISGILGMGNSPTSLVSQLGHRFSYCLPTLKSSRTKSTVVSFGQEAVIKGNNVQTTHFMKLPKHKKLLFGTYKLKLNGISVGGKRLELPKGSLNGGCIIDTGAPFSLIEEQAYEVVINEFSNYFSNLKNVKKIVNRKYPENLCYSYPRSFRKFPNMVLHLEGADMEINGTSLFMFGRTKFLSNFVCLQLLGWAKATILGVHQQQNMKFLYDLENEKLSFARENC